MSSSLEKGMVTHSVFLPGEYYGQGGSLFESTGCKGWLQLRNDLACVHFRLHIVGHVVCLSVISGNIMYSKGSSTLL